MTRTSLSSRSGASADVRDRGRLEAILRRDPVWGGYAIADLDDRVFDRTTWLVLDDDSAMMALYQDGDLTSVTGFGDADGAAALLRGIEIDGPCDVHLPLALADAVHPLFDGPFVRYLRMGMPVAAFVPAPASTNCAIRPLIRDDLEQIRALNAHYPLSAFQPDHLTAELHLGAFRDGQLLGLAGTHISSPTYRLAAIGSIVTTPAARGQGIATALTSALCTHHAPSVDLIVLNVGTTNPVAQRIYERIGFVAHMIYDEGIGVCLESNSRRAPS